jgi:hypothetical protein
MWMQSPQDLLRGTIAAYREQLALVLADLQALGGLQSGSAPWLVEGTSLLPDALADLGIDPQQAIWIVPEEAFQRRYYARRGDWLQGILSTCRDPQQAFENWMSRDAAFARWVREQARQRGLFLLEVDGRLSIPENAAIVAGHFGLASPQAGPASA